MPVLYFLGRPRDACWEFRSWGRVEVFFGRSRVVRAVRRSLLGYDLVINSSDK